MVLLTSLALDQHAGRETSRSAYISHSLSLSLSACIEAPCRERKSVQRTPRGGGKEGAAKPHEETSRGKQFPTPLTSVRFAPPLFHFS